MSPISLTCPALTGGAFPRWYDVAHDNREAAKTPSRRRTVPSTPIARLQSVRCRRSNHARPRLHAPNASQAHPRRACDCTQRDRQHDCGRSYQDYGCRSAVAGRRGQIRATWRLNVARNIRLSATLSARASKVAGSCSRGLSQRRDAPRGPSSDSCVHSYAPVIVTYAPEIITAIRCIVFRTLENGTCVWNFSPAEMQIYFASMGAILGQKHRTYLDLRGLARIPSGRTKGEWRAR